MIDDEIQPDDVPEEGPSPLRYLIVGGLVALLVLVAVVVAVRARNEFRLQSGIRFAERGTALLEAGEVARAVSSMKAALQLAPLQVDVQRRAAHLFSAVGNANAFIFWHNLFLLEAPQADDVMAFTDWCRRVGREELIPDLLPNLDVPEVQLARALTTTNVFERITVLDRLATNASPMVRFEVALQGCLSTNVGWVRVGRDRMLQLAQQRFEPAQIFLLTQVARETELAARSLEQAKPDPWLPRWKPLADFVLRQVPLEDSIRQQGITNQAIAMFLRRQNQSLLRPDWMRASLTNYPLFLMQAEQLAERGQWKELALACAQTNRILLAEMRSALSMLAKKQLGLLDEAFRFQTEALNLASGHPARLLNLLSFSRLNGRPEFTVSILREFCQLPGWREKASKLLFQLGVNERRLTWMIEGAEYLANDDPDSPWYGAWIYGRALLEPNLEGVRPPRGQLPDQLIARSLLLARQGAVDRAIDALESIPEGYRNMHWRVVAAFVYRAGNQKARASELIRRIDASQCFEEERYLLGLDSSPSR